VRPRLRVRFHFPAVALAVAPTSIASRPDGSPARVWNSHEDIVYSLAFDSQERLLAGTGNRGHVFAITGLDDYSDLLKAPASQVTAFAKAPGGALYAATQQSGKSFRAGTGV